MDSIQSSEMEISAEHYSYEGSVNDDVTGFEDVISDELVEMAEHGSERSMVQFHSLR